MTIMMVVIIGTIELTTASPQPVSAPDRAREQVEDENYKKRAEIRSQDPPPTAQPLFFVRGGGAG